MLYDIKLTITHTYQVPSGVGRTLVHMSPRHIPDRQKVHSAQLRIDPAPDERTDRVDFFGNRVTTVFQATAHENLHLELTARVECLAPQPLFDVSPARPDLAQMLARITRLDAASPLHFIGTSPRIRQNSQIGAYARDVVQNSASVLNTVQMLGEALHRDIRFDPNATTVDTPPADAFAARRGVCQDISQIMIAGLRALGIPAGYVSGFIRTLPPEGMPRLEGADATHAWVRAWCGPQNGWVEYDPTNATFAGTDHIIIGYGRDYSDVGPVKGVHLGSGEQSSHQGVSVIPLFET